MNRPSNIHCLALNYYGVGPAKDKEPLYFVKYSNSFVGMKVSRRDSGITYIGSITKISSNDFTASFDDGKVLDYSFRG